MNMPWATAGYVSHRYNDEFAFQIHSMCSDIMLATIFSKVLHHEIVSVYQSFHLLGCCQSIQLHLQYSSFHLSCL